MPHKRQYNAHVHIHFILYELFFLLLSPRCIQLSCTSDPMISVRYLFRMSELSLHSMEKSVVYNMGRNCVVKCDAATEKSQFWISSISIAEFTQRRKKGTTFPLPPRLFAYLIIPLVVCSKLCVWINFFFARSLLLPSHTSLNFRLWNTRVFFSCLVV